MKEFTKDDVIIVDEDGLDVHFGDIVYSVRKLGGTLTPEPFVVPTVLYYRDKSELRYFYFLNKESAEKRSREIRIGDLERRLGR